MAMTKTLVGRSQDGNPVYRFTETGVANTQLVATCVADNKSLRVLSAYAVYSANPTQAGVTFKIDNGAGSSYDSIVNTGSANARYTNYMPSCPVFLGEGDAMVVDAPAGGAGITASVSVYAEELRKKEFSLKPDQVA